MVQYYERYGSYYNMLDNICGNEGVKLRIFSTILYIKESIEPQNCNIVDINVKFCVIRHTTVVILYLTVEHVME